MIYFQIHQNNKQKVIQNKKTEVHVHQEKTSMNN